LKDRPRGRQRRKQRSQREHSNHFTYKSHVLSNFSNQFFVLFCIRYSSSFLFWLLCFICALAWLPTTLAQDTRPHAFPNPTFKVFSDFILSIFNPNISLTTVLLLLFSLTDNPEILNLHARHTHPVYDGERKIHATGWMKAIARGLENRLGDKIDTEIFLSDDHRKATGDFAKHLDSLSVFLRLTPYSRTGKFKCKIHHISRTSILPIRIICPPNMTCTTISCKPHSLLVSIPPSDSTNVTLIEGITITDSESVYLMRGKCTRCDAVYHPDHENYTSENGITQEVFINSARYLKIGASVWVDRVFSNAVLGGLYNFHASTNAYMLYWNQCFGNSTTELSRRQIWQAFAQESIRSIAEASDVDFEAKRELDIDDVNFFFFFSKSKLIKRII
jgi:hypothetical protein